jgi:hypothetical protein
MKIILYDQIDHLDLKNEKSVHSMGAIHTLHSTIAQLSLSLHIYIERERVWIYRELNSKSISNHLQI